MTVSSGSGIRKIKAFVCFYRLRISREWSFRKARKEQKYPRVEDRSEGSNRDRDLRLGLDTSLNMPDDPETYLAVLKAAYDYEPQPDADEELAIKEDQVLLLIERVDDELSTRTLHFHPPIPF